MDIVEVEENLFAVSDAKLHGGMCKTLSVIYCKVLAIFPRLEAARPRSKSGIQALCSLHVALEKTKNILQHCSNCSKLYLAITGDSVLLKFEKVRHSLIDSLRKVEDIVPQSIGCQILEILDELEAAVFLLDSVEKQIGDDIVGLLQQGRSFNDCGDNNELELFHQAATQLGITSSKAALTERRALKKLIDRARNEDDKRKESIVAYLLHLMRKYSKLFRGEISDDNDSQGSAPCSPTVVGSLDDGVAGNGQAFDKQLSNLSSFNFRPHIRKSMPLPPEELKCPISLQIMYDPVIISSGQTYERICIEKWFADGHNTCPKTQQKLSHLGLTPNYCVKGLIASWCEQNGFPVPNGPPESLDLNYWRLALSDSEKKNCRSGGTAGSGKLKEAKVVPMEDSVTIQEAEVNEKVVNEEENCSHKEEEPEVYLFYRHQEFMAILNGGEDFGTKCKVVEQIRFSLKDDEAARVFMGDNGFVEALVWFLASAINVRSILAQDVGAMALFNLGVNNNRNKEMMLEAGVIPLLEEMIDFQSYGSATALYLNLSCLEEAKPIIGTSRAVPFLIRLLREETEPQCRLDALHTLYNLSMCQANLEHLLLSGIISCLQTLLAATDHRWTERAIAVLINLAGDQSGRDEMSSNTELISALSTTLDTGEPFEQEQAVLCLLALCSGDEKCIQMVLREGVIPALVSISVNGTVRGKEKAQKLLMLFRQQRQREPAPGEDHELEDSIQDEKTIATQESKPMCKSISRRKTRKGLGFLWKSRSYSVYQC
ncbi:hypothetical protein MLD38_002382 [Melastoma candidum]|uniref:Uncharacterized protein n=1 Tax=Melastoma candidum TaxID=119954 RepID=A0ACB9S0H0_9MYRT|nr:hypothetical protein MLD38_002382 [Melastoma candidum]